MMRKLKEPRRDVVSNFMEENGEVSLLAADTCCSTETHSVLLLLLLQCDTHNMTHSKNITAAPPHLTTLILV